MRILLTSAFPALTPETERRRARTRDSEQAKLRSSLMEGMLRMTEGQLESLVALWTEAQRFFSERQGSVLLNLGSPDAWFDVRFDASSVIERLERFDDPDFVGYPELGPSGAVIDIDFSCVGSPERPFVPATLAERFLDQLWLAMNVAYPGSLNLAQARCPDEFDSQTLPRLSSEGWFEMASRTGDERWPPLKTLPFGDAWEWLHHEMVYAFDVAESPAQIALATLLEIGRRDELDPANVLSVAQALECLLGAGKDAIATTVRKRLELVLGAPTQNKSWFSRFYDIRSRIVHGSFPLLRPVIGFTHEPGAVWQKMTGELDEAFQRGLAVELALLQDLIRNRAYTYVFLEHFERR